MVNERITHKAGVTIVPTRDSATAAGKNDLKIVGQTESDFIVNIWTGKKSIQLNLGRALVGKDLGCDVLCGEPGKCDNDIITIPRRKIILFCFQGETHSVPYLSVSSSKYSVCRVVSASYTVFPKDSINIQVPEKLENEKHVSILPRKGDKEWYQPGVYDAKTRGLLTAQLSQSMSQKHRLLKS